MKDFYRSNGVNGNPYVWMYTDDNGELMCVPCDKEGWIDAEKYPPSCSAEPIEVHVTIVTDGVSRISRYPDQLINQQGRKYWARNTNVLGWHPILQPMKLPQPSHWL